MARSLSDSSEKSLIEHKYLIARFHVDPEAAQQLVQFMTCSRVPRLKVEYLSTYSYLTLLLGGA